MPAISDWLVVIEEADMAWEPTTPKRDPMPLIPGLSKINLTMEMMLHFFVCTLTAYLDSPSKWHELAQRGLEHLLTPLCTSMWLASKQPAVQQSQDGAAMQLQYFNTLASASEFPTALLCTTVSNVVCCYWPDQMLCLSKQRCPHDNYECHLFWLSAPLEHLQGCHNM